MSLILYQTKKLKSKKMAEFSKQYQESFGFDWNDFDYEEIFQKLEKNQVFPIICEGLGTLAVARSENDEMLLGVQDSEDPEYVVWKTLDEAIEIARKMQSY
jgi:hypothetical protein